MTTISTFKLEKYTIDKDSNMYNIFYLLTGESFKNSMFLKYFYPSLYKAYNELMPFINDKNIDTESKSTVLDIIVASIEINQKILLRRKNVEEDARKIKYGTVQSLFNRNPVFEIFEILNEVDISGGIFRNIMYDIKPFYNEYKSHTDVLNYIKTNYNNIFKIIDIIYVIYNYTISINKPDEDSIQTMDFDFTDQYKSIISKYQLLVESAKYTIAFSQLRVLLHILYSFKKEDVLYTFKMISTNISESTLEDNCSLNIKTLYTLISNICINNTELYSQLESTYNSIISIIDEFEVLKFHEMFYVHKSCEYFNNKYFDNNNKSVANITTDKYIKTIYEYMISIVDDNIKYDIRNKQKSLNSIIENDIEEIEDNLSFSPDYIINISI